jgi:hypothetical protein
MVEQAGITVMRVHDAPLLSVTEITRSAPGKALERTPVSGCLFGSSFEIKYGNLAGHGFLL